jgi:hypothetical protein
MDGACSANGGQEIRIRFSLDSLKGRNHSEDLVVDVRI